MFYKPKHCFIPAELQVKDIDEPNNRVDIYVSAMGIKDSDGDIIYPGAFLKTIKEKGPQSTSKRIKHLKQHNPDNAVGKPEELHEQDEKLRALSVISKSDAGRNLIEDYKLDLFEHSIGFRTVKGEKKSDHYAIYEVELWEYSSVTWGANEHTPLNGIKSMLKEKPEEAIEKVHKRMNLLVRAITKGNYTDDRFEALEIELKQIQQLYQDIIDSLKSPQKPEQSTSTGDEPKLSSQILTEVLQKNWTSKILN